MVIQLHALFYFAVLPVPEPSVQRNETTENGKKFSAFSLVQSGICIHLSSLIRVFCIIMYLLVMLKVRGSN